MYNYKQNMQMFQRLMEENPDAPKKVVPLEGDVNMEKLGLSEIDKEHIISEVSVVIHSAATLRLEAKLKDAINMNVKGTARVLELCKSIRKLKVSTYCMYFLHSYKYLSKSLYINGQYNSVLYYSYSFIIFLWLQKNSIKK